MLKTYSITARIFQVIGALVLAVAAFLAIAFLRDGDRLASLFCGIGTLASAAFIVLVGWMRKQMQVWSEKFPPSVR